MAIFIDVVAANSNLRERHQLMTLPQIAIRCNNVDEYRHSVERMMPAHYLQSHYYERVLTGATTLLVEKGIVSLADLEARAGGAFPLSAPISDNPRADLTAQPEARFEAGDRVRVLDIHPSGHTRAPRFCKIAVRECGHLGGCLAL